MYNLQATYFDVGLGACGHTDKNADHIVAVRHFDSSKQTYNNDNQLAGHRAL
jgi:hypothetical protein